jgi:N-acetyl-anhydromuramyl-L-alanine amidase AmpD
MLGLALLVGSCHHLGPGEEGPYLPGEGPLPRIGTTGPAVPRAWAPRATARPWQYIVIHHSATEKGDAVAFQYMHTRKGWDELGYHFVIGNGTESSDGEVEVGSRWAKQKWGAHTKSSDGRYNQYGIGICLVGNFEQTSPTDRQWKSAVRLVAFLMARYDIPPDHVLGHRDCWPTLCPGKNLSVTRLREDAQTLLRESR